MNQQNDCDEWLLYVINLQNLNDKFNNSVMLKLGQSIFLSFDDTITKQSFTLDSKHQ